MSRRMASTVAATPDLQLELRRPRNRVAMQLGSEDIAELRRSIGVVRRLVQCRVATLKGNDAVDIEGQAVDPLDDRAARLSLPGAFLRSSRKGPSLYVAWMRLCNETAADLLDDPTIGVHAFTDDSETDAQALLELLDEVEARLERLVPPH